MELSRTSVPPVAATGTIEWAPFTLAEGVAEATLLAASEALQRVFLSQQPGFVRRELLRGNDNQWVDLVYWASQEAAEAAMQNVAESPVCHRYFALMAGADADEPGAGVLHFAQVAQY
ncbi:MAG TPA: hypothetical protein PKD53_17250 [Chloroflexaceae bacterium]|nr:hypothetical protein [Chloroflexaceae bacterium]